MITFVHDQKRGIVAMYDEGKLIHQREFLTAEQALRVLDIEHTSIYDGVTNPDGCFPPKLKDVIRTSRRPAND